MKRSTWLLLLAALCCALLAGCASRGAAAPSAPAAAPAPAEPSPAPDGPIDGGRTDDSDPNAPKTIASTELTEFSCRFSTLDAAEPGRLGNRIYSLTAKLDGGAVRGEYAVYDGGSWRTRSLAADDGFDGGFMGELGSVVECYELARHNGLSVVTAGIPDDYGARLEARYASGESIYAADNQDNFLSSGAMEALVTLFERGAAAAPKVIDFIADTDGVMLRRGEGWGLVRRPVYTLGYYTSDGELQPPDGCEKLAEAVARLNDEAKKEADAAWDSFGTATQQLSLRAETEPFVTRADSEVLSFYERTTRFEDASWKSAVTEIRTHNLETATGRELGFADVFRDLEYLPYLLAMTIESGCPEQTFRDDAADAIRASIESGDGGISFALSYGFVHIFAEEGLLNDEPDGQHVTLSCVLNPYQVRAFYTKLPERFVLPMDYDVTYWPNEISLGFRMHCYVDPDEDAGVLWELTPVGGGDGPYEEDFYGYAPRCLLAHADGKNYVYLHVPVGDVSYYTNVYEVTDDGVKPLGQVGQALRSDSPLDPDRLLMSFNDAIFAPPLMMAPYAACRVGADGMPEATGGVFDLDGPWVQLREGGRYNPDKRENAAVSGGMWTLIAGQRLRPYQTDRQTYLDFIADDGRVVRFGIDRFDYDMQLDNFGPPDAVFVEEGVG